MLFLFQSGFWVKYLPNEVISEIENAAADLRKASGSEDVAEILTWIDAANKAQSKIGEHMQKAVQIQDLQAHKGVNKLPRQNMRR